MIEPLPEATPVEMSIGAGESGGREPFSGEELRERNLRFIEAVAVAVDVVLQRVQRREERRMGRLRRTGLSVSPAKDNPALGKGVEKRRDRTPVTVASEMVRAEGIDYDEDDPLRWRGLVCGGFRRCRRLASHRKKDGGGDGEQRTNDTTAKDDDLLRMLPKYDVREISCSPYYRNSTCLRCPRAASSG